MKFTKVSHNKMMSMKMPKGKRGHMMTKKSMVSYMKFRKGGKGESSVGE